MLTSLKYICVSIKYRVFEWVFHVSYIQVINNIYCRRTKLRMNLWRSLESKTLFLCLENETLKGDTDILEIRLSVSVLVKWKNVVELKTKLSTSLDHKRYNTLLNTVPYKVVPKWAQPYMELMARSVWSNQVEKHKTDM